MINGEIILLTELKFKFIECSFRKKIFLPDRGGDGMEARFSAFRLRE